jgi:hypothetical protein
VENFNLALSQNGRVDFEQWSAYKIQLHGIEWVSACQPTETKVQQKISFLKFMHFSLIEEVNFLPSPLVLFKDQINLVFKAQKSEAFQYKGQYKLPVTIAVAEIGHS